jgi:DNA-binding NarL/FixJ family response regulator
MVSRAAPEPEDTIGVLVVDDHEVVRRGLQAFLDGEGDLEVVGAADGAEQALELIAQLDSEGRAPSVVLMDLKMSPVDGIKATREIRARHTEIEVVVLTSFGEEERVHAAIRAAHRGDLQIDPAVARRLMSSLGIGGHERLSEALTARELEVLTLVGAGKPNKEIAAELEISERTARTHVSNLLRKLGLASRTQAALWAVREGLVELEDSGPDGGSRSIR